MPRDEIISRLIAEIEQAFRSQEECEWYLFNDHIHWTERKIGELRRMNVDVSRFDHQLAEMKKASIVVHIEHYIQIQDDERGLGPILHPPSDIEKTIEEGRALGMDVSGYEQQLPEIKKKWTFRMIKRKIELIEAQGMFFESHWTEIGDLMKQGRALGLETAEFQTRFAAVKKKEIEKKIEKMMLRAS